MTPRDFWEAELDGRDRRLAGWEPLSRLAVVGTIKKMHVPKSLSAEQVKLVVASQQRAFEQRGADYIMRMRLP